MLVNIDFYVYLCEHLCIIFFTEKYVFANCKKKNPAQILVHLLFPLTCNFAMSLGKNFLLMLVNFSIAFQIFNKCHQFNVGQLRFLSVGSHWEKTLYI